MILLLKMGSYSRPAVTPWMSRFSPAEIFFIPSLKPQKMLFESSIKASNIYQSLSVNTFFFSKTITFFLNFITI